MRKQLIIELEDDDFRAILGALLKTRANFTVKDLHEENEVKPIRAVQRKDAEGRTAEQVLLNFVLAQTEQKISLHNLHTLARTSGFAEQTLRIKARKLVTDGILKGQGDSIWAPKKGEVA